jgi:lipopolysaccharide/colanic/teichoic acid biosynthesis glycosyltransferase
VNSVYVRYGKRVCDIILALLLLITLSWFILIIMILYVITFQFPILFKQQRIGKDGIPFVMHKFRSLLNNNGSLQERRFALGDFLRFTNADEIPQLLNVLAGTMSLVGPRPLPVEYQNLFTEEQKQRHHVLPGITGYAQVYGKNAISWDKKFEYDLQYVAKVSFLTDVKILLKTVTFVLSMKRDVSLQEEKFKG